MLLYLHFISGNSSTMPEGKTPENTIPDVHLSIVLDDDDEDCCAEDRDFDLSEAESLNVVDTYRTATTNGEYIFKLSSYYLISSK